MPPHIAGLFNRQSKGLPRISESIATTGRITSHESLDELRARFLSSRIPDSGRPAADYFSFLENEVLPHAIHAEEPTFVGHMHVPLPTYTGPLIEALARLNQNVVKIETSRVLTFVERETLAMLHRLLYRREDDFYQTIVQDRESTLGLMLSGGTLANLSALWCARNHRINKGETHSSVGASGMSGCPEGGAVVVGSELMHYSLAKAVDLLGLGTENLIRVPVDEHHRISLPALQETLSRLDSEGRQVLCLIGIAGTTDSGAVDPLAELAQIAKECHAHFHVDASWGGPMSFAPEGELIMGGIQEADSIAIDGHKQMYLPLGTGMVLFRDPRLADSIAREAAYIIRPGSEDLGRRSLEGSRPAMSLLWHAGLHIIGQDGYRLLMQRSLEITRHFCRMIADRPEFELLVEPQLNIVLYRFLPPEQRDVSAHDPVARLRSAVERSPAANKRIDQANMAIQEIQFQAANSFVSRTVVPIVRGHQRQSVVALRAIFANPLTEPAHLSALLDEQCRIYAQL